MKENFRSPVELESDDIVGAIKKETGIKFENVRAKVITDGPSALNELVETVRDAKSHVELHVFA